MPGVAHRKDEEVETEAEQAEAVDEQQDAADQRVAVRESHQAIEREELPDDEARETSPDVDESELDTDGAKVIAKRGKTVRLGGGTHEVTRKDSLWELSKTTYGHGKYWKRIRAANPGKVRARSNGTRDLIRNGDVLALPVLEIPPADALEALTANDPNLRAMTDGLEGDALLQMLEVSANTGMTYSQMVSEQRYFMEQQAEARGISVGEYIEQLAQGSGGSVDTSGWDNLSSAEQEAWQERFDAIEPRVRTESRPEIVEVIQAAEDKGAGHIAFDAHEVLARNAFATGVGGNMLVGMEWVEAAEQDLERVAASVMHEMVAHASHGKRIAAGIGQEAVNSLDDAELDKVSDPKHAWMIFGYWELEIFAELYEFTYDSDANLTDHPFDVDASGNELSHPKNKDMNDVRELLGEAKERTAPSLLPGLVQALWHRIENDPKIVDRARELFLRDVRAVMGDVL